MRVAFLTREYALPGESGGGLGNYLARVCRLLKERGHEPVVFWCGGQDRAATFEGVPVHETRAWSRVPVGRLMGKPVLREFPRALIVERNARALATRFRAEHARRPFDLVQAASYLSPGAALARDCPVPLLTRVSSYTPLYRAGNGYRKTLADVLVEWMEVRQMQLSSRVFAPSALMCRVLARFENLNCDLIRTPPGEHAAAAGEDGDPPFGGAPYLLFFGKLNPVKGVDLLGEALGEVLRDHPSLHAVLAGGEGGGLDRKPLIPVLRTQLAHAGGRIHIDGPVEPEGLRRLIRHAKVVVLPSRVDNYPNACLEAQAMGRIVVGTDESSLDEMVVEGETGFLAKNGSVSSLEATIRRALALSPLEHARMEENVRAAVAERSDAACVAELIAYYEDSIREWKAKAGNAPN